MILMANVDNITDLLKKREQIKKKKPHFIRTDAGIIKRLKKKWKRPRGRDNKIRRRIKGSLASPSYGSPVKVKGMHPRGFFEVLVSNTDDLLNLDASKHIVRIRACVGTKKKRVIIKKAKELKLSIVNPRIKLKIKPVKEKKGKDKDKEASKKESEKAEEKSKDASAAKEKEQKAPKKELEKAEVKKTAKKEPKKPQTKEAAPPVKEKNAPKVSGKPKKKAKAVPAKAKPAAQKKPDSPKKVTKKEPKKTQEKKIKK